MNRPKKQNTNSKLIKDLQVELKLYNDFAIRCYARNIKYKVNGNCGFTQVK